MQKIVRQRRPPTTHEKKWKQEPIATDNEPGHGMTQVIDGPSLNDCAVALNSSRIAYISGCADLIISQVLLFVLIKILTHIPYISIATANAIATPCPNPV